MSPSILASNEAHKRLMAVQFFPGFYYSQLDDACDRWVEYEIEYRHEDHGGDHMDLQEAITDSVDWPMAHRLIAEAYAEQLVETIEDATGTRMGLRFESMTSPRFYNFETDRLFVEATEGAVLTMLGATDPDVLRRVVADQLRPRSGFIPFYSDDVRDWSDNVLDWDHNQLGVLLAAFVESFVQPHLDEPLDELIVYKLIDSSFIDSAIDSAIDWDAYTAGTDAATAAHA